jgi:hypothetical protein
MHIKKGAGFVLSVRGVRVKRWLALPPTSSLTCVHPLRSSLVRATSVPTWDRKGASDSMAPQTLRDVRLGWRSGSRAEDRRGAMEGTGHERSSVEKRAGRSEAVR